MVGAFDVVVRDAYLQDRDEVLDVGIADGRIERLGGRIAAGDVEVDAEGNLVSPGFVDAHVHLDQALSVAGERQPKHNEEPFSKDRSLALSEEYFASTSRESIEDAVVETARTAVSHGVLHARTHTYVDEETGTKSVRAVESARERVADLVDIQSVAFPQQGVLRGDSERVLGDAVRAGADLIGGLDPASVNRDIERTLDAWFSLASRLDVGVDVHLHEPGSLGLYTLDRLLAWVDEYGYEGRVTASHAYALADAATGRSDVPGGSFETLLQRIDDAGLNVVTCYLSTPPGMPVRALQDRGIAVGHGSDQVRDFWLAHGNVDPLEEALIQSLNLGTDYEFTTNRGLDRLWRMLTTDGAAVLGIADGYGLGVGTPADVVVHDSPSRQWAIVEQGPPRVVVKNGRIVARDGEVVG
jgi:cytosine/adenosine deaminase-related metal-dependent hydrolase